MAILVVNCGSTSIKAAIIDPVLGQRFAELKVERLGSDEACLALNSGASQSCPSLHADAITHALPRLLESVQADQKIECVGHRIVHGGPTFVSPMVSDDQVISQIEKSSHLAPLHTPANLAGLCAARVLLPNVPHVVVFDTAFHHTIPRRARTYAVPQDIAVRHDLRRYGFHGTSHQFVAERAAEFMRRDVRGLRIVTCHLGGGCSVCAVENGRSIETSMGMTPLEGLVMGTRSGDIDPGAIIHLIRNEQSTAEDLDRILNHESGLAGLSGIGSDLRDIERLAEEGNEGCRLALQVFCHRVRKYIGAYAAVMGGVDVIVFTAGIGQNSSVVRHRVAQRLDFLGAAFDERRNREARVTREAPVARVSCDHSRVSILAVMTDEAWAIARHCVEVTKPAAVRTTLPESQCNKSQKPHSHASQSQSSGFMSMESTASSKQGEPRGDAKGTDHTIPVAISARHVHLTQEMVELLFGEGHQLTPLKSLSQPGQFAAQEQVTLVGPKRAIERVRVLGPTRSANQVEISRTDEFFLGIDAPIRASGDVENSPGITLIGTDGRTQELHRGVICAWRHLHMTPEDAEFFGVADGDTVDVEVGNAGVRSLTFGDVLVRVKSSYKLEMHIDTDEGNAAELSRYDEGELEVTHALAELKKSPRSQ